MNQGCTGRISSQKWISVQVRLFDRQMINANDKGIARHNYFDKVGSKFISLSSTYRYHDLRGGCIKWQ